MEKGLKKLVKIVVIAIGAVIVFLIFNPLACVGTTERGVRTLFGAVQGNDVLMPGITIKAPLVGGVIKRSITPNETKIEMKLNRNAAVSSDTQEIGVKSSIFWRYDENKISDIVRNYQRSSIDEILLRNTVQELRAVIGEYSVFDLAHNTAVIADKALAATSGKVIHLPIVIIDMMIEDFDWSAEVDRIVEQKIAAMASVEKAAAEADRAEQEQRRLSIEAEAQARADVARAEGRLRAAQLDADAKRAEGQAIADYNRLVSVNMAQEIRFRELEIQLERAKRWNGNEIPTYLPLNPAGGIVTLPSR